MVKNYMEIVVEDILPSVLEDEDLECKCDRCLDDIKALTLNNLDPKYVATEKGIIFIKLDQFSVQSKADIVREITIAIGKVKERPRH